jgi:hypothetical protein
MNDKMVAAAAATVVVILWVLVGAFVLYLGWNKGVVPAIDGVRPITYQGAIWLNLFVGILQLSSSGRSKK